MFAWAIRNQRTITRVSEQCAQTDITAPWSRTTKNEKKTHSNDQKPNHNNNNSKKTTSCRWDRSQTKNINFVGRRTISRWILSHGRLLYMVPLGIHWRYSSTTDRPSTIPRAPFNVLIIWYTTYSFGKQTNKRTITNCAWGEDVGLFCRLICHG